MHIGTILQHQGEHVLRKKPGLGIRLWRRAGDRPSQLEANLACVAGALAGAMYGLDRIPSEWIEQLRGKEVIDGCLF